MRNQFLEQIKNGVIVSCQALPGEPLHSSFIMSRMAKAAKEAGAIGIRSNSIVDIQAIQDTVNLPIIGIIKKEYDHSEVFITPTLKEIRAVCATNVEVVAIDATLRTRPDNMALVDIIKQIKQEYPDTLLMADTSCLEDVKAANESGFDIIGTTLYGYTTDTKGLDISDNDFDYLKQVLEVATLPVIAEGKINLPEKAKRVLELGCTSVVVGGAITRPQEIAERFVHAATLVSEKR
ncbi:MAG: N-acetylmannosamine-6-phosphate 2-epimerase [Carnobacterium sp.]|nr:N-acetylmannosamine-6-phosphate 2-epimerase [Carnobacterium sp.]